MEQVKEDNNQAQDNNKITAQYEKNIKKLVALVGGKENLSQSKKVKKDIVTTVVTDLLKDRREESEKTIKAEILQLLDKKVTCDKEIKLAEEQLGKLKIQKNKEFNESASKLFNKIEGLDQLEKDFYATLGQAVNAGPEVKGNDEEK